LEKGVSWLSAHSCIRMEASVIRILVVDDNPAVRRFLRAALEREHCCEICDEAGNGAQAILRFQQAKPDLILLDFQMPEMNGLEAARQITGLSPDIPILMVTMYLSKQLIDEARKVGIRGACEKTNLSSVMAGVGALLRQETYFPS